jgi:hypothetical protein
MQKNLIHYFLLVGFVFLYSCEYELENTNYVELKKPEAPVINVSLNAPVNERGEYLIHYPHVKFKIDIPEEYTKYQFYFFSDISNSLWLIDNNYLIFAEYDYLNDICGGHPFTLKCEVQLQPDTLKSIAEISNYEYSKKTFEWNIVIDPWLIPQLNVRCEKKGDKIFRLTWDEPNPFYGEVDYYEVEYSDNYSSTIYTKTNQPFYDISLPDGAYSFYYRIRVYFKEEFLYLEESDYKYID